MTERALKIMRECQKSHAPLQIICEAYGIEIKSLTSKELDNPEVSMGPAGGAIDTFRRIIFHDRYKMQPHQELHEIIHIILAMPFWGVSPEFGGTPNGIEGVAEEWLLFPFEKEIAKKCLSPDVANRVVIWQLETGMTYQACASFDLGEYISSYPKRAERFWKDARKRCFQLGLLDEDGPTFEWPKWERLSLKQVRWLQKAVGF